MDAGDSAQGVDLDLAMTSCLIRVIISCSFGWGKLAKSWPSETEVLVAKILAKSKANGGTVGGGFLK